MNSTLQKPGKRINECKEREFEINELSNEGDEQFVMADTNENKDTDKLLQMLWQPGTAFFRAHKRLYLALLEPDQAAVLARHILKTNYVLAPVNSWDPAAPPSLASIYTFDLAARALTRQNPGKRLVFCAGHGAQAHVNAALLLGSHMMVSHGASLARTNRALLGVLEAYMDECSYAADDDKGPGAPSPSSCWSALARVVQLKWVDFGRVFETGTEDVRASIMLEEFLHYARFDAPLRLIHSLLPTVP